MFKNYDLKHIFIMNLKKNEDRTLLFSELGSKVIVSSEKKKEKKNHTKYKSIWLDINLRYPMREKSFYSIIMQTRN